MKHFGRDFVVKFLKDLAKAASTSLLIILFFILQYIFDMDFKCSCTSDIQCNEVLYMIVSPVILTWILFYIKSCNQRRICDISKTKCCSNFLSFLCQVFLQFMSVGAIWLSAVLLYGDWYFCVKTKSDSNHIGVPCKEKNQLTDEEKDIENGLKIESLNYGMIVICVLLLIWTVAVFVKVQYYRRKHRKFEKELCCPPYYKVAYEHLLAEQVGHYLKEKLTQLATERAKVICQKHIQIIEDYEKNIDANTVKVEDSWHKISASDFYMQQEEQEVELN
ncbi:hypothetical protein NQD34_015675 [Periophthalmus magnuspinnatus]|nr:hypothetical protein NQD34_015675 [Periophthalmus magnuspinnatus]